MSQKKTQPSAEVPIKFIIDASSMEAAKKLRTDEFIKSVKEDAKTISYKVSKGK